MPCTWQSRADNGKGGHHEKTAGDHSDAVSAVLHDAAVSGGVFSLVMDVWTVLWYDGGFRWQLYLSALVAALPHTALYILSNVLFLWLMQNPIGRKLERVRIKYGV